MQRLETIVTVLCLWFFMTSGPVYAGAPAKSKGDAIAPKAVFLKTNHHFGEVFEGAEVKHDFVVENQGTAPLVIKNIRPD